MIQAIMAIPRAFLRVMQLQAEWEAGLANLGEMRDSAAMEASNAAAAARRGAFEASLHRMKGSALAARQRVIQAAGGGSLVGGTAEDARAQSAVWAELDAQTSLNNARAAALGHKTAERRYRVKAEELSRRWEKGGLLGQGSAYDEVIGENLIDIGTSFGQALAGGWGGGGGGGK